LLALLRGRYVLESGDATGLSVHYVVTEDGSDNLPRPPTHPDEPNKPLDYLVDVLRVSNALVRYENRAQQVDVMMPVEALSVDGNPLTDRHAVVVRAAGGTAHASGRDVRVDTLSANLDVGRDDVRFDAVAMQSEGSHADLSGSLTSFDAPVVDVRVKADIDVERAGRLAGVSEPAGGQLTVDAAVKGPFSAVKVSGAFAGRDLRFREVGQVSHEGKAGYDAANVVWADGDGRIFRLLSLNSDRRRNQEHCENDY
jgi:hypothetical protein